MPSRAALRLRGDIICAIREARGRPAGDLADAVGIDKHLLSHIEHGRRVGARHADAFAAALDIDVDVLTGRRPAITALRVAEHIDPDTFAADIGVDPDRLARLERGTEHPDDQLAQVIATRLGVNPDVIRPPATGGAAA